MPLFDRPAAAAGPDRRRLEELRRRLKEAPGDVAAALGLADALAAAGETPEAVTVLSRAGAALQKAGKAVEAIAVYKKVAQIDAKGAVTASFFARLELEKLLRQVGASPPSSHVRAGAPAGGAAVEPPPDVGEERARAAHRAKKEAVLGRAAGIPFLKDVPPFLLELVLEKIQLRTLEPGELLFREGETGSSLVFVASGELSVAAAGGEGGAVALGTLGPGSVAGEISFLSGFPRTATVAARTRCDLLELPRPALDTILRKNRGLAAALAVLYRERVLDAVLARSLLFRGLPREERDRFASRFVAVEAAPGEGIVAEGNPDDALYLIRRGEVRVTARHRGRDVPLALLSAPEIFGDVAALRGTARTASVVAVTAVELLRLSREDLHELLERHPGVKAALEEVQLARFVATSEILDRA